MLAQQNWYDISRQDDGTYVVFLYGDIGIFGASGEQFARELRSLRGRALDVHIDSPGGDTETGAHVAKALKAHDKPVRVVVDGIAHSIAAAIAVAADEVVMTPGSQMMIHDAFEVDLGARRRTVVNSTSNHLAAWFAMNAGGKPQQWRAQMRRQTYFTAEEAVAAGLASRVGNVSAAHRPRYGDFGYDPASRYL